jgi:hypothetical protein
MHRRAAMYDGEIRICEVWLKHPEIYGIASAKLVVMFGDEGVECWTAGIWRVSFPKKDLYQQIENARTRIRGAAL